jgi:hypothetical protein
VLSSGRDDSFQKVALGHYLFFLPRELRNLCVLVLFLSKNENNNGFDAIGLNFFSSTVCVRYIFHFAVVPCIVSLVVCFRLDEIFAY